MKTEIMVPFAIDTDPVEQRLQEDGYAAVLSAIKADVLKALFKALPRERYRDAIDWKEYVGQVMWEWLDAHASEVVDIAAELLARKANDRRNWRTVLSEMRGTVTDE